MFRLHHFVGSTSLKSFNETQLISTQPSPSRMLQLTTPDLATLHRWMQKCIKQLPQNLMSSHFVIKTSHGVPVQREATCSPPESFFDGHLAASQLPPVMPVMSASHWHDKNVLHHCHDFRGYKHLAAAAAQRDGLVLNPNGLFCGFYLKNDAIVFKIVRKSLKCGNI